jgi:hypothetical protein
MEPFSTKMLEEVLINFALASELILKMDMARFFDTPVVQLIIAKRKVTFGRSTP